MNFTAPELSSLGEGKALFDRLAAMKGETYRQVKTRRTFRFEMKDAGYFAKVHFGVGWREIFKNLASLRLPIVDASNELAAIRRLEALGVPTMTPMAYVCLGTNPARRQSAIVTRELIDTISLEDVVLQNLLTAAAKPKLINEVARIARIMHQGGVNHRDLYICHFHLQRDTLGGAPSLFVIDLHRAQVRSRTPRRWAVKDVAALFFSTFDAGLSRRDYFRFIRRYAGKPVKQSLVEDAPFWRAVAARATRLYRAESGEVPAAIEGML